MIDRVSPKRDIEESGVTDVIEFGLVEDEFRDWLRSHRPGPILGGLDERFEQLRQWQITLYEAGWLGIGWPAAFGGRGGTLLERLAVYRVLVTERCPLPVGIIGLDVVGPTILEFGTDDQCARLLPPLLRGDEIWCQGFSEPDAGSDLASLRTTAIPTADGFLVNGQKVWTSWAQFAHRCALLARTDTDAPPHAGISYLLVNMTAPGITVRPLEQLTGDAEFNEVFFDDVPVDANDLLGPLNGGWGAAMNTLTFERGPYSIRRGTEVRAMLDDILHDLAGSMTAQDLDSSTAERLGHAEVLVETLLSRADLLLPRIANGDAGPETSLDKLFLGQVEQAVTGLGLDLLGHARTTPADTPAGDRWVHDYLYGRAASIYGGSAQVQRDIITRRVLNLPRA
jgi:alkylation response protein AidB-like acyl-CoA dehydrogenase